MSSTQIRNFESNINVVVRAFGDEPVKLAARSIWGEAVEVIGDNPNRSGFFPVASVFCFDEKLFRLLKTAFDQNDRKRLIDLWNKAAKFADEPKAA